MTAFHSLAIRYGTRAKNMQHEMHEVMREKNEGVELIDIESLLSDLYVNSSSMLQASLDRYLLFAIQEQK